MSASLVGSEMCIRDRTLSDITRTVNTLIERQSALAGRLVGVETSQRSLAAVSYTHLTLPTICSV
eukprot:1706362-Alexandrium_andersonii.AAC.1